MVTFSRSAKRTNYFLLDVDGDLILIHKNGVKNFLDRMTEVANINIGRDYKYRCEYFSIEKTENGAYIRCVYQTLVNGLFGEKLRTDNEQIRVKQEKLGEIFKAIRNGIYEEAVIGDYANRI